MRYRFVLGVLWVMVLAFSLDSYAQVVSDTLVPYRKGNKWGYMNTAGDLVIKTKYEEAYPFENSLGRVKKNGKYGFICPNGVVQIPIEYNGISDFKEGVAYLTDTLLYLDTLGNIHKARARCGGSYTGRIDNRLINLNGLKGVIQGYPSDTVIYPKYNDIKIFDYMNVFAVKDNTGKYGVSSDSDTILQPFIYDTIFVRDYRGTPWLETKIGNYTGAINLEGKLEVEAKYEFVKQSQYCFLVGLKNEQIGFVYNRKEYWKH